MLNKLMRYEFMAIRRIMLPLSLVFVSMTIFSFLIFSLPLKDGYFAFLSTMTMALYFISLFVYLIVTTLYVVVRFYKNLITSEGYLMFTLPVKTNTLVLSKVLTGLVTDIAASLLVLLSLVIMTIPKYTLIRPESMWAEIDKALNQYHIPAFVAILVTILFFVFSFLYSNISYFACIAVGSTLHKNKILGAFLAYVILNAFMQFVSVIMVVLFSLFAKGDSYLIPVTVSIAMMIALVIVQYRLILFYFTKKLNLD